MVYLHKRHGDLFLEQLISRKALSKRPRIKEAPRKYRYLHIVKGKGSGKEQKINEIDLGRKVKSEVLEPV